MPSARTQSQQQGSSRARDLLVPNGSSPSGRPHSAAAPSSSRTSLQPHPTPFPPHHRSPTLQPQICVVSCSFGSSFGGRPSSCDIQAHKGDRIKVHYRGKLTDETVFDSSFERGDPIEFELGAGRVIKGWDQGLLGMCVGEKRKLKIPAKLGYGPQGSPPTIPGGATLIFDTELVAVNGKPSSGGNSDL